MAQPGGQAAALAMDGGDPRLSYDGMGIQTYSQHAIGNLHDPNVKLEEYMYYASLSRAEEKILHGDNKYLPGTSALASHISTHTAIPDITIANRSGSPTRLHEKVDQVVQDGRADEKNGTATTDTAGEVTPPSYLGVSDAEWALAARARRTAGWGAIFYLITTDILGPFSVPWALSQMGYGPGIALYFVFGIMAFYAGFQMWQMFMVLDSGKYPLKTYGDIAFRIYGKTARHGVNILQSIQLFFNVGILILNDGQSIYQLSQGPHGKKGLCFIVCSLVFTLAGLILGQIRTLARFGWIANLAIWLNVIVLAMTMGVAAHTAPNYIAANAQNNIPLAGPGQVQAPVKHSAGVPDGIKFNGQVVGLMQAVYSYGGAMLYCEFMSEMKKPWDFFKAQLCAETFIFCCYIFFGIFVYYYQGQYTIATANQGLSPYTWQSVTNAISLVSALIAAALYGNIGIKVLYQNVFTEIFGFPLLESKKGKILWCFCVPVYWGLAFIICSGIPNMPNFSGLIAAACIMQFSYTFPPILMFGLDVQRDAMLPEETFDPSTGEVTRVDAGWKRWARGLKKQAWMKTWYILFFLGSLATAILGIYSSVLGLKSAFKNNPHVTSYSCTAPI